VIDINKYIRFLLELPEDATPFEKCLSICLAVPLPIYALILLIAVLFSFGGAISGQNDRSLFQAVENFQYVNRMIINYNSEVFEVHSSNYNFVELKNLLDPRSELSYHSFQTDMSEFSSYIEIDYFVGNRRILSAFIYKLPQGFVADESDRLFVDSRRFAIGNQRGILLIDNYNRNVITRFFTRTVRLSCFGSVEFDVAKMMELLR